MGWLGAAVDGVGAVNRHRGFIASWPQFGVPGRLFLANLAVLFQLSGDQFLIWGWRVPFLQHRAGRRRAVHPAWHSRNARVREARAESRVERAPVSEVLRRHPREIALTAFSRMAEQGPFTCSRRSSTLRHGELHLPRNFLLVAVLTASAASFVFIPLFGHLSDLLGRKRVYMTGAVLTGIYGFVYFRLLDTREPAIVFAAIALSLIPHDMLYGPQAALIAESFPARLRYSGASLGYQSRRSLPVDRRR